MGQPPIPATPEGTDLSGKTVVITGGNAGMGYDVARQFLILNAARVILAVRSQSKGQEAVSALRANPDVKKANPSSTIEMMSLDLDDYQSTLEFANKIKAEVPQLDVLLCNGGVNIMKYQTSRSGHERVMQVNCYSHFFLALALLPLLRTTAAQRGAPSHLTIVGSVTQTMHSVGKNPLGAAETVLGHFDDPKKYSGLTRYSDSKLAVSAFCRQLAMHVPASEVIVNNPCPGLVATGFDKQLPLWLKPIMYLYRKISARPVEEGGRALVYASYVAGAETHGRFLQSNKVDPGAPFLNEAAGEQFAKKLWSETIEEGGKLDPDIKTWH